MRDKVNTQRDKSAREQLERNEEVAASAEPQGDGVPDAEDAGGGDDAGRATARVAESGAASAQTLDEAQRALEQQRERFLRLAAEYDNYRKRTSREQRDAGARAQGELMRKIVDSLDDLGRVIAVDPAGTTAASVIEGVDLVEKKLMKALGAAGLEIVNPVDQPFNPELHEAVATQPALSPEDDHMVAQVYQPGYLFAGQLLRPARVVVKQWNG
ncbi:MAG: nucleotide exchange factor GrpE [Gemmatimonadaceae bacterium]